MASIKKRGNKWQYRITYKDDAGNIRTKNGGGFRTKKDCEAAAAQLDLLLKKGIKFDAGKIAFCDYFKNWFELFKKDSVSEKTGTHYLKTYDHVKAYFGLTPIANITEDSYQSFLNKFGSTHAKETAGKINTHCKSCFKRAVKTGVIHLNPAEDAIVTGAVKPKNERTKFLNIADLEKVLAALMDNLRLTDASRHLIIFSLASGVRFSEALGLTWDCIDFKKNVVRINKTWDSTKNDFGPTKNEASNRVITIDPETIALLEQFKVSQERRGLSNKNLVFLSYLDEVPTNNSVNTSLKRAIKRAGVTTIITHHGLRHTHVSVLLHKKVNIKYISRRIGHATVSTTYDTYAHIIDEMEQTESLLTTEIITEIFDNAKTLKDKEPIPA